MHRNRGSAPRPPGTTEALAVARGDVRDGVASIEHFLQVLGSRRVGPRVLARGIPEVVAGCTPLRTALGTLAGALGADLAADPDGAAAARALLDHAAQRVEELSVSLSAHEGASLDARDRLGLEAIVRKVALELGTVVRLVDLLGAAVTSETTTIDLGDAFAQRRAHPRAGARQIHVAVEVRVDDLTVGDARLVLELIDFGVAMVVRAGVAAPRLVVDLGPDGFARFTIDEAGPLPAGAKKQVLDVVVRDELPREADVVCAAARRAGIELAVADDRRRVTIAL
jgi:hypothetical protein